MAENTKLQNATRQPIWRALRLRIALLLGVTLMVSLYQACLVFPELQDVQSSLGNSPPKIIDDLVHPAPNEYSVLRYYKNCTDLKQPYRAYVEDAETDTLYYRVFIDYEFNERPHIEKVIPPGSFDANYRAEITFEVAHTNRDIEFTESEYNVKAHIIELLIADRPFVFGEDRTVSTGGYIDRFAWTVYREDIGTCIEY